MTKISVIVPVYNVEKYIKKCIDSLINQTLKDIEIIIVNDGSLDNSQLIIDEYVKKYPNIIKSYIKENGGSSSARNYGIKFAKGEFIAFIDSDDYVDITYLENLYNNIIKTSSDIAIVGYKVVKEDGTISYDSTKYTELKNNEIAIYEKEDIIRELLLQKRIKNFVCKLCKKEIISMYPIGVTYEDIVYSLNLMKKSKRVVYINSSLYNYLKRSDSITATIDEKNLNDFANAIMDRYNLVNKYYSNLEVYNIYALLQSTIALSSKNLLIEKKNISINKKIERFLSIIREYISNSKNEKEIINMLNDVEKECIKLLKQDNNLYYDYIIKKYM